MVGKKFDTKETLELNVFVEKMSHVKFWRSKGLKSAEESATHFFFVAHEFKVSYSESKQFFCAHFCFDKC